MKTSHSLLVVALMFVCSINSAWAQLKPEFLDKGGNMNIYGGITYPESDLSSNTSNGLFAENGFQFGVEANYIIKYGFGIGLDLGGDWFKFNQEAFSKYANPETIDVEGGYSSTYFGLNIISNIPIVLDKNHFTINLFIVGTPGLRGMRIPSIDLTYNETLNKYVEVSYQSRASTAGYLAFRGGIQFLINNTWGLSLSYKRVMESQQKLNYSVRMFDAEGELYEEENYISSNFKSESYQIGLIFLFGVK